MQGRYRNPNNDGFRSGYRNHNRGGRGGGGGFGMKSYLPPPPPRKEEILMEAGRLAAEYLSSKGLLPPNSLPPKWPNSKFQEFKGQDRDHLAPADGRTSALNRLGSNPDPIHGRRRYADDYDTGPASSRNQFRGRKRMNSFGREYGSEWGRDDGRWMGRNRGYSDNMEGEDDYAPGYHRGRRSGFDQLPSRSELTGESGSENHDLAEDTGSKASSSSTRREPPTESDVDLSKVGDVGRVVSPEAGEEVKSDASGDSKKKDVAEEETSDVQNCTIEADAKGDGDLLKFCGFSKVPTRPRSSASQKSLKIDQEITGEAMNAVEVTEVASDSNVTKVTAGKDLKEDFSSDSLADQNDTSKTQTNDTPNNLPIQPTVESVINSQQGASQAAPVVNVEETNQREGIKRPRESSPEDEYSRLANLRIKQSSPEEEKLQLDEEMIDPVPMDEEKSVDTCFPQVQPELEAKLEEEKQLLPTSFKICDLNLMGTPEITEIPDDPVLDHLRPPAPRLDTGKELSMDFGLSIGSHRNGTDDYSQLPIDDKVVQVIDLEDDSHVEANDCDPSKPKDEPMIYPNLDNFLSHADHADLPGIQDGYSISEFLGSDISRCPSMPSDLNTLQTGMGLHDAEGVPNDDDSIYVSLGEIPIGFMEVWDQPPQDYEKFF